MRDIASLVVTLVTASAAGVRAEPAANTQTVHAPQAATPSAKRPLPDYDGRGGPRAEDGAAWIPRVALAPLYLTSEYVLRRPLGAVTAAAERAELPRKVYNFFAFGPDHKLAFVPVAWVEFGFRPSVGIYAIWTDAFFLEGHDLRVHYEAWPEGWLSGSISHHARLDERWSLRVRAASVTRPDYTFYGIGPSSRQRDQSRYTERRFDLSASLTVRLWRSSLVEGVMGVRRVVALAGRYDLDPSVDAQTAFPVPDGFGIGYIAPYGRVTGRLDTRRSLFEGSGVRLEAQAEQGADAQHAPAAGWVRWGATATGFVDLKDLGRVLSLSFATLFAERIGGQPVPFTELVSLGGNKWMHGFFGGRLVDRSAAVASLRYTWPIAPWLGGTLQTVVGNVFGAHLQGVRPGLLRLSGAVGLVGSSDPPIHFLVAFGTDTFERGAAVESVRFTLGVPHSF